MAGWVNYTSACLQGNYVPSLAIYNLDNSHWENPNGEPKECTFKHLNGQNHPQCLTNRERTDYRKEFFTVNISAPAGDTIPSNGWTYVDPGDIALPNLPLPGPLSVECPISICLYPISIYLSWSQRYAFYFALIISFLPTTSHIPLSSRSAARIFVSLFGILASILAWLQMDRPGNSEGTAFNIDSFVVLPLFVCVHLGVIYWWMDPTNTSDITRHLCYMYTLFGSIMGSVMMCLLLFLETSQSTSLPAVIVKGLEGYRITTACYHDELRGRTELWAPSTGVPIRNAESLVKVELPLRAGGDMRGETFTSAYKDALYSVSIASMQAVLLVSSLLTASRAFVGTQYGKGYQWGLRGIGAPWLAQVELFLFRGMIYLAIIALVVATEGAIGRNLKSEVTSLFQFSQWGLWLFLILLLSAAPILFPTPFAAKIPVSEGWAMGQYRRSVEGQTGGFVRRSEDSADEHLAPFRGMKSDASH